MIEDVKIKNSKLIAFDCVEINAIGPNNSHRNFTVTFDRKGKIAHGYLHEPEYIEGYLAPIEIPDNLKKTATRLYQESITTV